MIIKPGAPIKVTSGMEKGKLGSFQRFTHNETLVRIIMVTDQGHVYILSPDNIKFIEPKEGWNGNKYTAMIELDVDNLEGRILEQNMKEYDNPNPANYGDMRNYQRYGKYHHPSAPCLSGDFI